MSDPQNLPPLEAFAAARKHAIPDREARTIHKSAETALGRSLRELRGEVAGTRPER